MSLFKYFGVPGTDQGDNHGGRLFWSSHLEAPYRGRNAPMLTRDEYDHLEVNFDAKVATFDMSDAEQQTAYREILDRAANGWYVIHHTERNWDRERNCMMIYVEWLQKYTDLPPHVRNTIGGVQ